MTAPRQALPSSSRAVVSISAPFAAWRLHFLVLPRLSAAPPRGPLTNEIENDFQFHPMQPPRTTPPDADAQESRCRCGNLLARLRPEGVELKCRRCKRVIVISWGTAAMWHNTTVQWQEVNKEGVD